MIARTGELALAMILCVAVGCHRDSYPLPMNLEGVSFEAYSAFRGPSLDTVGIWSRIITAERVPPGIAWGGGPPSAQFELVSAKDGEVHKWEYYAMKEANARKQGMEFVTAPMLQAGPITPEMRQNQLTFSIATREVLGDSLPNGRYKITLLLPILGAHPVPAGFLELRRSAPQ